ncbi:probable LRR receptor-like serine/threonine-protein kinase At4g36180 [Punica granatum]|uniref:Probable LRR receptor-like serine/threonine-protein kinase At4g36180 n=1 Tax=Punica granatum TaxID=22663 RepID=A0A6P8EGB0_PUNGR|nr:probable LRR receptor-like serine/threonine-protein kinase At4g36180 [Punica granatum]
MAPISHLIQGQHLGREVPTAAHGTGSGVTMQQMRSLEELSFADNKLGGTIPPCLGNLSKISYLSISFNRMQGSLPRSLANCTRLKFLSLFSNGITDSFPNWLRTVPLRTLQLGDNNFHGLIGPDAVALDPSSRCPDHRDKLFHRQLASQLARSSPKPLHSCFKLEQVTWSSKNWRVSSTLSHAAHIDLSDNNFRGAFPTQYITNFKGMIGGEQEAGQPVYLSNDEQVFYATSVMWKGVMLELQKIRKALAVIDLSRNHFKGKIPGVIGDLKLLIGLNFSQNNLTGAIPIHHASFPETTMAYEDDGEKNIQAKWYKDSAPSMKMRQSNKWSVNCNKWDEYKSLQILTTSPVQNNLTGAIPYSFGNLTNLEWIDLSLNNLSGEIPGSLADLTSLAYLNLSVNRLMGPIPKGKQFNTFKGDSFGGNPGLCGFPLPRECREDANKPAPSTRAEEEKIRRREVGSNGRQYQWVMDAGLHSDFQHISCFISATPLWLMR